MNLASLSSAGTHGQVGTVRNVLALWLLCAIWLGFSPGLRPLMLPDEGRYVGVAWEMLASGNWLVPTLDGLPFFHKPPLFYWLTGLALKVLGTGEWSARAASFLAANAAAIGLCLFLRRWSPDQRFWKLALAILVTQPLFFGAAQFANLDLLVAALIALAVLCAADASLSLQSGRPFRVSLTAAYCAAALGVLAKGLIGIVLPGAIVFLWLLLRRKLRQLGVLLSLPQIVLFLLIAGPWFWRMEDAYPGFLEYFFVHHHFQRFAAAGFNNPKPFWFYLPVLLLGALPWSPWLYGVFSPRFYRRDDPRFEVRSLMGIWVAVVVVFFSLPKSKLIGYILPALPALAVLMSDVFLTWLDRRPAALARRVRNFSLMGAVLFCMLVLAFYLLHGPPSLRGQLPGSAPSFHADDQIVMIDEYQYDLPFYLQARKHPWVVSDWGRPDLVEKDNWRRELFEAAKFDAAGRQERLLYPDELTARACSQTSNALWVWGKKGMGSRYPFLTSDAVVAQVGNDALWRVIPESVLARADCGEKPRNG